MGGFTVKRRYWMLTKFLLIIASLIMLAACGNDDSSNDEPAPQIVNFSSDTTSVSVSKSSDSSIQLTLRFDFDDQSTANRMLNLDWNSTLQQFDISPADGEKYQLELLGISDPDVADELWITDLEAEKTINIPVDLVTSPALISAITFSLQKTEYTVGDVITPIFTFSYTQGASSNDIPPTVDCIIQTGESVLAEKDKCSFEVVALGQAQVGLTVPADLLAENVSLPQIDIVATTPPVPQRLNLTNTSGADLTTLQVASDVSIEQSAILQTEYDKGLPTAENITIQWQHSSLSFNVIDAEQTVYPSQFDTATEQLTITDPVSQLTIVIEISTLVKVLRFDVAEMTLLSGQSRQLDSIAEFEIFGKQASFNDDVECSAEASEMNLIKVSENCEVAAWLPGVYTIEVNLLDPTLAAVDYQTQSLQLTVSPVNLGSLSNSSTFILDQTVNTSLITFEIDGATVDEIYKVTLNTVGESSSLSNISLDVFFDWNVLGCKASGIASETSLACGIKAIQSKLYLILETTNLNDFGVFNYTLTVEPDIDILNLDGDLSTSPVAYQVLTVGPRFLGHVPANEHNFNNISLYKTDVANGMNPTLDPGDYRVKVEFQSRFFQENTVVVRWDSSVAPGDSIRSCSVFNPTDTVTGMQLFSYMNDNVSRTIECIVPNAEQPQNIVVEIYGNGLDSNSPSITGVEGEVSYEITITQ